MDNRTRIASMLVAHRYAKNLTQTKVSKKLGVTFQQVQKYERMINKITSDRLIEFCNALDIRLQTFQDGDPYQVLDGSDIPPIDTELYWNQQVFGEELDVWAEGMKAETDLREAVKESIGGGASAVSDAGVDDSMGEYGWTDDVI